MKTPKFDTSIDRLAELERATAAIIEAQRHLKAGHIRLNEFDHRMGELAEAYDLYKKAKI